MVRARRANDPLFTGRLGAVHGDGTVRSPAEAAIDMTLLGRYYERYADHAVAVARRTIFIVTGHRPVTSRL